MSVKLTWTNPETVDTIDIYRSETVIDIANLPTALVSGLAGTLTEYSDITAQRNHVYHYVIKKTAGTEVIYSPDTVHGYFPDTGPGPVDLLRGNWTAGYFGPVAESEFFLRNELAADVVAQKGLTLTGYNTDPKWHKFIFNGKILFIPLVAQAATTISWDILYSNGLVYGLDEGTGFLPANTSITPVAQNYRASKDGYEYRVRLPRMTTATQGSAAAATDLDITNDAYGDVINSSEFMLTMARAFYYDFTKNPNTRLANEIGSSTSTQTFGMEQLGETGTIIRSGVYTSPDVLGSIADSYTSTNKWRPVLELVL